MLLEKVKSFSNFDSMVDTVPEETPVKFSKAVIASLSDDLSFIAESIKPCNAADDVVYVA